jgi:hypothetical protein
MLLVIWGIITSPFTTIPTGYIDFPCYSEYDSLNECIHSKPNLYGFSENNTFESFISVAYANFFGMGCAYNSTNESTFLLDHVGSIIILDKAIIIDGHLLHQNNTYSRSQYLSWNFWTVSHLDLTYYGMVPHCGDNQKIKRHVIAGDSRSKGSFIKGLIILGILILIFIQIEWKIRKSPEIKRKNKTIKQKS